MSIPGDLVGSSAGRGLQQNGCRRAALGVSAARETSGRRLPAGWRAALVGAPLCGRGMSRPPGTAVTEWRNRGAGSGERRPDLGLAHPLRKLQFAQRSAHERNRLLDV